MLRHCRIAGLGKFAPPGIVTNADLEKTVDTTDEWIRTRTGIRERHVCGDDETASTMATQAALQALEMAGIEASSIDLIIAGTTTPDYQFPSVALLVQEAIGATRAGAFDVNAACMGWLSGLAAAVQFISGGMYDRVLVVGTEALSRILDWEDRSTCVLFGDGAGAVILEASDRGGPLSLILRADGSQAKVLWGPGPAGRPSDDPARRYKLFMDGPAVFKQAVGAMERATRDALEAAGLGVDDISLFVPHQANLRIITAVAKALRFPMEKTFVNLQHYGNTSAASIPIALREAWEEGLLKDGDKILLASFASGLVWGAMVFEWTEVAPSTASKARAEASAGG